MAAVFLFVFFGVLVIAFLFCLYMLGRNDRVYEERVSLIGDPAYYNLPSYDEMMRKWWKPVRRFVEEAKR